MPRRAKSQERERGVGTFLPYTRHVAPHIVGIKSGGILAVIKLKGISFETIDDDSLQQLKSGLASLWQTIAGDNVALYYHLVRRPQSSALDSVFDNRFCHDLDAAWQDKLSQNRQLVNEHYLTVLYQPTLLQKGFFKKATVQNETVNESVRHLEKVLKVVLKSLAKYQPETLSSTQQYSDVLSFLSYLVNFEHTPVLKPTMGLDTYLPKKRLIFGKETFEVRGATKQSSCYGAILSLKEYPAQTDAGMFNQLLHLNNPFIITQSYQFVNQQMALTKIRLNKDRMASADSPAISLEEQLNDAMDDISSNRIVFGKHHLTITLHEETAEELEQAVAATSACLAGTGLTAVREDNNLQAAFISSQVGNFSYVARSAGFSSDNFAGFVGFHSFPEGKRTCHWGSPVTILETTSGTPYNFSFHDKDVGNFTIIGPTGSGKTLLMLFLLAQSQRYNPRTVYFDKDSGAEIAIRAMGGSYQKVSPDSGLSMNPLLLPDTAENKQFLREWLGLLLVTDTALTTAGKQVIADAIETNYTLKPEDRRLSVLRQALKGQQREHADSLAARLGQWCAGNERSWIFDNPEDCLTFDNKMLGLDMTYILEDKTARTPWLFYVMYRIDQVLNGGKTIIMLDEGWKLLDDAVFSKQIKDWEKTIRKKNGVLGFATQSAQDAVNSAAGKAIIEQSPTQIFLPNHKADEEAHIRGFGLTYKELEIIRKTQPDSRCFLIKHGTESVVAKLNMEGLEPFIQVLSGRSSTVSIMNKLRDSHGDNPDQWLPVFQQEIRKEQYA